MSPVETKEDYYAILQITQNATVKEITTSYRRLAKSVHPDRNPQNLRDATARFQLLHNAYETLTDANRRRDYDRNLPSIRRTAEARENRRAEETKRKEREAHEAREAEVQRERQRRKAEERSRSDAAAQPNSAKPENIDQLQSQRRIVNNDIFELSRTIRRLENRLKGLDIRESEGRRETVVIIGIKENELQRMKQKIEALDAMIDATKKTKRNVEQEKLRQEEKTGRQFEEEQKRQAQNQAEEQRREDSRQNQTHERNQNEPTPRPQGLYEALRQQEAKWKQEEEVNKFVEQQQKRDAMRLWATLQRRERMRQAEEQQRQEALNQQAEERKRTETARRLVEQQQRQEQHDALRQYLEQQLRQENQRRQMEELRKQEAVRRQAEKLHQMRPNQSPNTFTQFPAAQPTSVPQGPTLNAPQQAGGRAFNPYIAAQQQPAAQQPVTQAPAQHMHQRKGASPFTQFPVAQPASTPQGPTLDAPQRTGGRAFNPYFPAQQPVTQAPTQNARQGNGPSPFAQYPTSQPAPPSPFQNVPQSNAAVNAWLNQSVQNTQATVVCDGPANWVRGSYRCGACNYRATSYPSFQQGHRRV